MLFNLKNWKKISNYSFYLCGVLIVVHTFFFEDVGFYSVLSLIEIIALSSLLFSELMKIIIKRR